MLGTKKLKEQIWFISILKSDASEGKERKQLTCSNSPVNMETGPSGTWINDVF
jgi:hypothetical protein